MTQREKSDSVELWVGIGAQKELVRKMDLAGAPLDVPEGYMVVFRADEIRGADTVELRFVHTPPEAKS